MSWLKFCCILRSALLLSNSSQLHRLDVRNIYTHQSRSFLEESRQVRISIMRVVIKLNFLHYQQHLL